ncbi:MAG: GlxA family transcriptional regulator [Vulcanimicrobiota bacterium]
MTVFDTVEIAVLVADGFTDSGLAIALDVFRAASAMLKRAARPGHFRVRVLSPGGGRVRAASGLWTESTESFRSGATPHATLVPGLWAENFDDLDALRRRPEVQAMVDHLRVCPSVIGASCGGTILLAEAGLLDGLEATTAWWAAPYLRRNFPRVIVNPEAALIDQGRILTAGAVFAMADLALHLVDRWAGPGLARRTANVLLLDTHASQARYMALSQLQFDDPLVRGADRWVRAHLSENFPIATLAGELGTTPRTLARHLQAALGLAPVAFVQKLRVEHAVQLLETTTLSVEEIGARVGYSNAATLSRLLRRETNLSPLALRRQGRLP